MIAAEDIIRLYYERRNLQSPIISRMVEIKDHYNGEVQVPLPELDKNEKAAVANLITQGLDQMAMRISSTVPSINYIAVKPGQTQSEEYARIRRLANYGWWQQNRFDRKQRKRARWLIGYSTAPVVIRPDVERGIPHWHLRDPLNTFPAPMSDPEEICPSDCVFAFKRPLSWLVRCYPEQARILEKGKDPNPDEQFEIVEYLDADEHVQLVLGKPHERNPNPLYGSDSPSGAPLMELERTPNRAERCTAVVPSRLGLDHPIGQFDGMPGLYAMQARAMAMWLISGERAIFPDTWFVSRPNETAQILQEPDGRAGIPGLVKGGDLKEVTMNPAPGTAQLIDLLERNQRQNGGIPAEFGGESPSNIRTGRRGDSVIAATVDYWVQEAQETLAASYEAENRLAVAISKAYFGNQSKSFYVNWHGKRGPVDYIPNKHFENDNQIVAFPHAGSDVNSLIIGVGQRLGLKEMSLRTAMEMDPYIDDPELEHERVMTESMEAALLASIDQAVAAGQLGPLEVARLAQLIFSNKVSLADAVQKVHEETQAQQAAAQAAQPAGGPPGVGGPMGPGGPGGPMPEGGGGPPPNPGGPGGPGGGPPPPPGIMAPGIAQTLGVGPANPPGEQVAPPTPSMTHLQQLIGTLHGGGK